MQMQVKVCNTLKNCHFHSLLLFLPLIEFFTPYKIQNSFNLLQITNLDLFFFNVSETDI